MATAAAEIPQQQEQSGAGMRATVGGVIALVLLFLYFFALKYAIDIVTCVSTSGCTGPTAASWTTGYATALSTVGGLLSALVIAVLSVTDPGQSPGGRLFQNMSGVLGTLVRLITTTYVFVWLFTGLWAYVIGVMQYPNALPAVTDLGQAWLGIAIAAGYAYFGIRPSQD